MACVANVSARVRRESSNESGKKKEKNEKKRRGRRRGEKETLAGKPRDFENAPYFTVSSLVSSVHL